MLESIDKKLTDQKSCPICFSCSKLVGSVLTINPKSERIVGLRECLECGHWWSDPIPTQDLLTNLYNDNSEYVVPAGYYSAMMLASMDQDNPFGEELLRLASFYSPKISFTEKNFNYLELGIGSGQLFNFFLKKANISYGIEPGKWVVCDKQNIVSEIDQLPSNVKFDIIIAHDVLEHLTNPTNMIKRLKKSANKGCIFYCTFPNKDSFKAKILKSKWSMIRPFGHLHYFSALSVKHLFQKNELEIIELKSSRAGHVKVMDAIKLFNYHDKHVFYRLIKSLLLGQLLLGKDQWSVIAMYK